jgi:predicted DNA-binding transcriptional regulator AlpA
MIQNVNSINPALQFFDQLPNSASVRLPVVMALFACSAATIWRRVKSGHIPEPFKPSLRVTCWNVGLLRQALGVSQ